ncbi:MAG: transposase [Bacteroidia bacterium]|nr:transposase [Bacteroidia bacterium]
MIYITIHWPKLNCLLDHEDVEIDNNLIENQISLLALGRKTYLLPDHTIQLNA